MKDSDIIRLLFERNEMCCISILSMLVSCDIEPVTSEIPVMTNTPERTAELAMTPLYNEITQEKAKDRGFCNICGNCKEQQGSGTGSVFVDYRHTQDNGGKSQETQRHQHMEGFCRIQAAKARYLQSYGQVTRSQKSHKIQQ